MSRFKNGDLVKFVDIHTTVDALNPIGLKYPAAWYRISDSEKYFPKTWEVGVIVIPFHKLERSQTLIFCQVFVGNSLWWFDEDNLQKV